MNSVINGLTQTFPTKISASYSHALALLSLFLSSDPCICSTVNFCPLNNCDYVFASVSIDFHSNSKSNHTAPAYARDWDALCDDLRDVPWEVILKPAMYLLLLLNFVNESRLKSIYICIYIICII